MESLLKTSHVVHFIGIGGIGVSAIARKLLIEGKNVSGSDAVENIITKKLQAAGAEIYIGQKANNIPRECDLIVYTVAVPETNPELVEAKRRNIPILTYSEALGEISKEKSTIAISGTHGKTTTTAMVAGILIDAGLDPTVIVGSEMKDPRDPRAPETNFIAGQGTHFVVEADEYHENFLSLMPSVLLVNNIDADHLDYYGDFAGLQTAYRKLATKIPKNGFLVCNVSDPNIVPVISGIECTIVDYKEYENMKFDLKIPGAHNRSNAAAAYAVARAIDIPEEVVFASLHKFVLPTRRFELKGETATGALIYDDYAHNPQKVKAAIQAAREAYPDKRVIAILQPHQYSRTKHLFNEFVEAFDDADEAIIAPIYRSREEPDPTVSAELLAESLAAKGLKASAMPSFEVIRDHVLTHYGKNDVILLMNAGDLTDLATELVGQ